MKKVPFKKWKEEIDKFRRKKRQTTQKLDKKPVTESGFNKERKRFRKKKRW